MKKFLHTLFHKTSFFMLFILFFLIKMYYQIDAYENPYSLILLDNSIVLVHNNGIHFYNNDLTEEFIDYAKNFTVDKNAHILMVQFPAPNGYILILIQSSLYIFYENKEFIDSKELSECLNSIFYDLIPYKVQDNDLYFIISYISINNNDGLININIYKFIINDKSISCINSYNIPAYDEYGNTKAFNGLSCFFLSPLESFEYTCDLLTCFTIFTYPNVLLSITFNPENDFNEISELRDYKTLDVMQYEFLTSFKAKANNNKIIVMIYLIIKYIPFWGSFDYTNKFSSFVSESLGAHPVLDQGSNVHKIFYFSQKNEFVLISNFGSPEFCNKFIMVFNGNCQMSYKGILYFPQNKTCNYGHSATVIYVSNNNNYDVSINGGTSDLFFNSQYGLENPEEQYGETEKVSTTYIETPTTIITTILTTIIIKIFFPFFFSNFLKYCF